MRRSNQVKKIRIRNLRQSHNLIVNIAPEFFFIRGFYFSELRSTIIDEVTCGVNDKSEV